MESKRLNSEIISLENRGIWPVRSLADELELWSEQYQEKVALVERGRSLTYMELKRKVDQLAAGFIKINIAAKQRIIVQLPNSIDFVCTVFALFRVGAIPVFALPAHRAKEISAIAKKSLATTIIVPGESDDFDYVRMAEAILTADNELKNIIVNGDHQTHINLQNLYIEESYIAKKISNRSVAFFLLSGGTTNTPKLIPRVHSDYIYNYTLMANSCGFDSTTVYLAALPVAHNFAFGCPGIMGALSKGGTVYLCKNPDPIEIGESIKVYGITATAVVPSIADLLLNLIEIDPSDFSSLKLLQVGGARLSDNIANKICEALPNVLQQVYGMAEGLICHTHKHDHINDVISSQGRPMSPFDEIKVVDDSGLQVKPGEPGELLTRGPYTILNYVDYSEAMESDSFTHDGFYKTGDIVRVTSQGNLQILGRKKETINKSGEKYSPIEIEIIVRKIPQILEVAVTTVSDDKLNESAILFYTSERSSISRKEVCSFLEMNGIEQYKYPDGVVKIEHMPKTALGKIDKKELVLSFNNGIEK